MSTEHLTVRENKVSRGRENAANPREFERLVEKVVEIQRGGEELRMTSSDVFGVCRDLCRRWKRDKEEVQMTSSTVLGVVI